MVFGYDASVFTQAFTAQSFHFAESMLSALRDKRRATQSSSRPLFLIGHSLGGIVIKKCLVIAAARKVLYGDILRNVRHLMFFGTPHQGSDSFLAHIAASMGRPGSVHRELKLWSPELIQLDTMFVERAELFSITSFFELRDTKGSRVRSAPCQAILSASHLTF